MIIDEAVVAAVSPHPAVERIELVGSRAEGRETRWSDWDFGVRTRDFPAIAEALPGLLAPLEAVVEQWDRLSEHQCWMLILRGPVMPSAENLGAIDAHLWDWLLWLRSKGTTSWRRS